MMPRSRARRGLPAAAPGVSAPPDRHYRRSDVRAGKRRTVRQIVVRAVRALVLPVAFGAAALWLVIAVATSPLLDVRHLEVTGTSRLSAGEVEALVADLRGRNILVVDFEQYSMQVRESPWVASVTMARVLPSTVRIQITERQPMTIARLGRQLYLVDATGVIIDAYGPQHREFDLPIVDGLIASVAGGGAVNPARLQATARLVGALAAHPSLRDRISQVDVSDPRDVVVLLGDDPARLHLGDSEFVERLERYLELAPTLQQRLAAIDYVDLRFGDRVFLRAGTATASVQRTATRQD